MRSQEGLADGPGESFDPLSKSNHTSVMASAVGEVCDFKLVPFFIRFSLLHHIIISISIYIYIFIYT